MANVGIVTAVVCLVMGCASADVLFACEGGNLTLYCDGFNTLNISSAQWGREGNETCQVPPIDNLDCRASNSLELVTEICQDHQTCSLEASNTGFGDPCPGTTKYLEVDFQCASANETKVTECEGGNVTLSCPADRPYIKVTAALYGRNGRNICRRESILTEQCSDPDALTKIQSSCDGKQTCTVEASNNVFTDPCVGTTKYLRVTYVCS